MSIFSFLTASRLKAEIAQQHNEITRYKVELYETIEGLRKQMADQESNSQTERETLTKEHTEQIEQQTKQHAEELERLTKQHEEACKQQANDAEHRDKEAHERTKSLRRELEEEQIRQAELKTENANLIQHKTRLESQVSELNDAIFSKQKCIIELEEQNGHLKRDVDKIMGNLTKW
jgi:chromosome segregation ATPase